jgi:Phosphotransferase enzyme family
MPDATPPIPEDEAAAVFGVDDVDHLQPLRPRPLGATVGVWRVRAGGSSAVLKLLRLDASPNPNWAASPEPSHPRWWRRELDVLQAGIVERLQPELRPPRLLHHADREDGSLALWLEDLGQPTVWTVEQIAEVAHLLGLAQARVTRDGPPNGLPRGFLRAYLKPRRQHLTPPFKEMCDQILDGLDRLPQTICHFDLHPANVFPLGGETAVIDWAYCGQGPLGSDAGVLASDAIADELIAPEEAERLVDAVWEAYREGLGDHRLNLGAERVYAVGTALRYSWLRAWLVGTYGPEMPAAREPFVSAAHDAFRMRAMHFL